MKFYNEKKLKSITDDTLSCAKWILIYLTIYSFFLYLPNNILSINSQWNWSGKLLAIAWSILFISICPRLTFESCRVTSRQASNTFLILTTIIYVICLFSIFFIVNTPIVDAETLAFQSILPGIDEELSFRGVILSLLLSRSATHQESKTIQSTCFAILLSSFLFALAHGLNINTNGANYFNPSIEMIFPFIIGLILCMIALKTNSLLIPVMLHNLLNCIGIIFQ